jgi:diguanylate cyclase (GGDEF)-like protein
MKVPTHSPIRLSVRDQQDLAVPAVWAGIAICVLLVVYGLNPSLPAFTQRVNLSLGLGGLLYTTLSYYFFLPLTRRSRALVWTLTLLNSLAIILVLLLAQYTPPEIPFLMAVSLLVPAAILLGRWPTYLYAGLVTAAQFVLNLPVAPLFDLGWVAYLGLPVTSLVVTETLLISQTTIQKQVNHLRTLNHVARLLSSSLDSQEVISLVCEAIQSAIKADTYYVGLLQKDGLRLELFYDDGELFPETVIPLETTLAGLVIRRRDTLLINDMSRERDKLKLPLFIVGKPRTSLSWMGTPMETGGQIIGMMAVASYKRYAFNEADLNLLKSLANQAAMAIDNAQHMDEVERRSQMDSLTGCLNHGSFLKQLEEKALECSKQGTQLGLIMIDIDHFKQYNDRYGHLIGDQVLCMVTETIRRNIKNGDLVGRWGGEEFAIALPNASGEDAIKVAYRLQKSMAQLYLANRENQIIQVPTLSQGIAVFPLEASEVYPLVDLADQRLYRAKERGRNQIEPQPGFWDKPLMLDNDAVATLAGQNPLERR